MPKSGNLILGLESSCDETAAAVVRDGSSVLSSVVASQLDVHEKYGGVVPELAARRHVELINPVIDRALGEAGILPGDLCGIAVTYGPGLVGGLLIALSAAKALCLAWRLPLIGVNHIEGHIAAGLLSAPGLRPPVVALVASGGHTDLVYMPEFAEYSFLGRTRDDAAGEAFDKVARILDLGYPGGPEIDRLARTGDPEAVDFPRPSPGGYDFSFSGLKTAVFNFCQKREDNRLPSPADIAASFQQAVVDVLVETTLLAAEDKGVSQILISGGVASNSRLRSEFTRRAEVRDLEAIFPPPKLCTDNAAMIAAAGSYRYARGEFAPLTLDVYPNLSLGETKYS